jgi:hypothetical protein
MILPRPFSRRVPLLACPAVLLVNEALLSNFQTDPPTVKTVTWHPNLKTQ